jgi:hypothetical protein
MKEGMARLDGKALVESPLTAEQEKLLKDFQLAYAQKYWDAANLTTSLMFGLAFGIPRSCDKL